MTGPKKATCPVCKDEVEVTTEFRFGEGTVEVLMNHDDPHHAEIPVCPGSLGPVK